VASRRDFFKSFAKPLSRTKEESLLLVRPPYGRSESFFQSECPSCESKSCVASCDEKIIFITDDGTPTLSFKVNGCTFCDDCANACEASYVTLVKNHA
jgi:ferredoxin-type protein NapF